MPDKQLVNYLIKGMKFGFRISFNRASKLSSTEQNMLSALSNRKPVEEFLLTELQAGRVLGPFPLHHFSQIHISRFGVIPKCSQPGKWRLILDLSSPDGLSVNDGISPKLCSLSYISVDHTAEIMSTLGCSTQLAKIDIAHAYRNVPVHPDDRHLLGMQWNNSLYVDSVLPFGLQSAPKVFSALADTLEWILLHNKVSHILHYLDDFLTAGKPLTDECRAESQHPYQHLQEIRLSSCH